MSTKDHRKEALRNELLTTYTYEQIYTLSVNNDIENVENKSFVELVDELVEDHLPPGWFNYDTFEPGDIA